VIARAQAMTLAALKPADAFARLVPRRDVFWADSSLRRSGDGRYSVMSCEPRWVFTAKDDRWQLRSGDDRRQSGATGALAQLDALLDELRVEPPDAAPDLPFVGGAMGWLSYDLGRQFEQIDGTAIDDLAVDDIRLAWYDAAVVWDHECEAVWLVDVGGDRGASARVELLGHLEREPMNLAHAAPAYGKATSDMSPSDYVGAVRVVGEGIARGEFYQLNVVQRFACARRESAATTYLRLRELNPAPFSAYFATEGWTVLSSSPERLLEVTPGGRVRTCPIKGTRPRADSAEGDAARRSELVSSAKERAELLMIVDLLRNDLGRVCVPGSVTVARLHALESFATVHHLVGEVEGQLRAGVTRRELLRAVFPGGSVTGAPKVSAMQAIDRLEPHRRGIAMGALGYISAHGRIDLNIAIRTIVCRGDTAYVAVGAGIVADSDPQAEYTETLVKARALFAALRVREVNP
jgi:para-aminobenzoate synthetase component I